MTLTSLRRRMTAANEFMTARPWLDVDLYRATSGVLELAIADDLTHHHIAVLRLTDVSFYCGPFRVPARDRH